MKETLQELILVGDFDEAKKILETLDQETKGRLIIDIACDTDNLAVYGLIIDILFEKESPFWHSIAAQLFLAVLCYIEGAYPLGLYHMRKAVLLDPHNIEFKQGILAFHNLPEPIVSKDEAIRVAKEIVALAPNNPNALDILSEYGIRHK